MMKSLRPIDAVAKRKSMMQFIARLILAFAFVASTAHTPAIAHEEPASHHADHKAASVSDTIIEIMVIHLCRMKALEIAFITTTARMRLMLARPTLPSAQHLAKPCCHCIALRR